MRYETVSRVVVGSRCCMSVVVEVADRGNSPIQKWKELTQWTKKRLCAVSVFGKRMSCEWPVVVFVEVDAVELDLVVAEVFVS